MLIDRVNFLALGFDRISFADVIKRLRAVSADTPYGYVVTPNVDHIIRTHQEPGQRSLYRAAAMCVCDSQILRLLARLAGVRLDLVRGSDLSASLFDRVLVPGDTVAVVGSSRARIDQLRAKFPAVRFLHHEPPMNLRHDAQARAEAARFIAASDARFSLIAVGSPQQEMIAHETLAQPGARGLGLCIGAGLDFVTGSQRRAPPLLQAAGLEWAHRLANNPRRLWKRYLVDGMRIIPIYWRWVRS